MQQAGLNQETLIDRLCEYTPQFLAESELFSKQTVSMLLQDLLLQDLLLQDLLLQDLWIDPFKQHSGIAGVLTGKT